MFNKRHLGPRPVAWWRGSGTGRCRLSRGGEKAGKCRHRRPMAHRHAAGIAPRAQGRRTGPHQGETGADQGHRLREGRALFPRRQMPVPSSQGPLSWPSQKHRAVVFLVRFGQLCVGREVARRQAHTSCVQRVKKKQGGPENAYFLPPIRLVFSHLCRHFV